MLHQQSAAFPCHLSDGLFYCRQLGMNQGGQGGAGHAAEGYVVWNAHVVFLERALGSQHGSLRKAKDRIERNVLFQVLLHHPAAFLGRQGWLQDVLCLICYMKLFQRVSISPLAFTTVSDIGGAGNVKNVLLALAQQGLHHEECHDVIVHAYL